MATRKRKPANISPEDWEAVDSPPLTKQELARMRPAQEVVPHIVEEYRRTRGPQKSPKKIQVTLRLDAEVVAFYKAGGKGWQTRLNDELRTQVKRSAKKANSTAKPKTKPVRKPAAKTTKAKVARKLSRKTPKRTTGRKSAA